MVEGYSRESMERFTNLLQIQSHESINRLHTISELEKMFSDESHFGDTVSRVSARLLIREWTKYLEMTEQGADHRIELAYSHILALGDMLKGKIDYGKLRQVIYDQLPHYLKDAADFERAKGYIIELGDDSVGQTMD